MEEVVLVNKQIIIRFPEISTLENFGPTNNAKELEQNINDEISKVATWLQCNKLKLNVSKSKFMLFFLETSKGCP